jgi:hypothetical protein
LAGSELQSLLRRLAQQSRVTLTQLDVASAADSSDNGSAIIPATIAGITDIAGLTELLVAIDNAPLAMDVTQFSVHPNPALKGNLLQLTATLRAPYTVTE